MYLVKSIFDFFAYKKQEISMCALILVCAVLQASCGQGDKDSSTQIAEPTESVCETNDCVPLSSVEPPEFGKLFAIMYSGNDTTDVYWGYTDNNISNACFMTNSSYPGFGYTIMLQDDYFSPYKSVIISTKYGEYTYSFVDKYDVFWENGELTNRETGNAVNQLDYSTERLAVYSSVTNTVCEYKLKKGTKIGN